MFSNFKEAFFKKYETDESLPKEIIKSISGNLPEGFQYRHFGNGVYAITTNTNEIKIGANIEIPTDIQSDFQFNNIDEIIEFAYRTQRNMRIVPDKEGCINLNGVKIKIEDMVKFPLGDENVVSTEWYIYPPEFQPPFHVRLESGDVSKYLLFQRQPYADMNKCYFKNIDNSILEVSYIIDEKKSSIKLTCNLDITKSKSASEILEGLKLYNSFLLGDIRFAGVKCTSFSHEDKALKETIEFWERIVHLEKKLYVEFILKFPITNEDVNWINKLYRSFVLEKPYKQYVNLEKITIKTSESFDAESIIKNQNLAFNYIQNSEISIWGVKLNLHECIGWFNLYVTSVRLIDNKTSEYELIIKPTSEKGIYQSIRQFKNEEDAEKHVTLIEEMANAEVLNLYHM